MYFYALVRITLLAAATVGASSSDTDRRGLSITITKRNTSPNGTIDAFKLMAQTNHTIAKIRRGMGMYRNNTGREHTLAARFNGPGENFDSSVPLTDVPQDGVWYGEIQVGTPSRAFQVGFDTGISDLFLPSLNCSSNCVGHTLYDPSASSTSEYLGKNFSLLFDGGFNGAEYSDVVQVAGATAHGQTFGAATQYPPGYNIDHFLPDGLMGMGFQSMSAFDASPVFQTLISEDVVEPIFSFKLNTSDSELYLGGVNYNLFTGDFTWVALIDEGHWQASFNSISVDGEAVVGETVAIFDTGTTPILGDEVGISNLFAQIPGAESAPQYAGLYTIPCNFNAPISIDVGGRVIAISPDSFNLGPVSDNSGICFAGAASVPALNDNIWILGDVFLRNVYSAWDVGNARIGFATLA